MKIFWTWIWVVLLLVSCHGPADLVSAGESASERLSDGGASGSSDTISPVQSGSQVGQTCQVQTDCWGDLYCELQVPNGYCTKPCQRSAECPGSSLCVRITFSHGPQLQRCIQTCRTESDCRTNFVCYRPGQTASQICLPVLP